MLLCTTYFTNTNEQDVQSNPSSFSVVRDIFTEAGILGDYAKFLIIGSECQPNASIDFEFSWRVKGENQPHSSFCL